MKKINLEKKSIDKLILNYSLEDIEEKLDLLQIKRNVINPAAWPITALQVNYLNSETYKEEDEDEIIKTEEIQPENIILKPEKILPPKKEQEKKKRLSREEELEWIRKIRYNILKGK